MKFYVAENKNKKMVRSESYNYNFDKNTGFFARWGKTLEDDPCCSNKRMWKRV